MAFLTQNWYWVALAVISGGFLMWPGLGVSGAKRISPQGAVMLLNREHGVLLDTRELAEHGAGVPKQAQSMPMSALANRIKELESKKSRPIIALCASGMRAGQACAILRKHGFDKLYVIEGGLRAWQDAGFPLKQE